MYLRPDPDHLNVILDSIDSVKITDVSANRDGLFFTLEYKIKGPSGAKRTVTFGSLFSGAGYCSSDDLSNAYIEALLTKLAMLCARPLTALEKEIFLTSSD